METHDFQAMCGKAVSDIDRRFNVDRDSVLTMSQLIEEIGELARVINAKALGRKTFKAEDIRDELADVVMLVMKMAELHNVDVLASVQEKLEVLKRRRYLI